MADDSDLNNVPSTYHANGGQFWVLVVDDETNTNNTVVGMCGLQVYPGEDGTNIGEIRRMCILPPYRQNGHGTKMGELAQDLARTLDLPKVVCSTPEHGKDVLKFYAKLGFVVDTEKHAFLHGTNIVKEVFLEWRVT